MHYKEVEKELVDLLNERGGKFKLTKDDKSRYDIEGFDKNGVETIIEVKNRSKRFKEWWMEVSKAEWMIKKSQESVPPLQIIYVCVVNGKYQFYDVLDIVKHKIVDEYMNQTTDSSFSNSGRKVKKKCYQFPSDISIFEI